MSRSLLLQIRSHLKKKHLPVNGLYGEEEDYVSCRLITMKMEAITHNNNIIIIFANLAHLQVLILIFITYVSLFYF